MSEEKKPAPLWRRALLWFGGAALVLAVLAAAGYAMHVRRAADRLAVALAELEAADPGWRLDDVMRSRPDLPGDENSLRRVSAIAAALPSRWPTGVAQKALAGVATNAALDPKQRAALDELLAPVDSVLPAARDLTRFPRGRSDLPADAPVEAYLGGNIRWLYVVSALNYDAWRRAQGGDVDGALASARASLNATRALDEEPSLLAQRFRRDRLPISLQSVERTLALGVASDPALAEVGRALERDERATGFTFALRAERAKLHDTCRAVAAGRISRHDFPHEIGVSLGDVVDWPSEVRWPMAVRSAHPDMLRLMTRLVEASRLPPWEQPEAEDALARQAKAGGPFLERFFAQFPKMTAEHRQLRARVAALRAVVAVERYRLRHGRWPAALGDVVPAFLEEVPPDPFDGAPLRLARRADGVVAYSVGKDRADDGGDVNRKDVGYRLWDADKRRVP